MCENTVSLFFSISAQGMAPSGMQFRTEKDTVACEIYPLLIIGTNQRLLTLPGTFTGSLPQRQIMLYIYAFRIKTRRNRVLENTKITGELPG